MLPTDQSVCGASSQRPAVCHCLPDPAQMFHPHPQFFLPPHLGHHHAEVLVESGSSCRDSHFWKTLTNYYPVSEISSSMMRDSVRRLIAALWDVCHFGCCGYSDASGQTAADEMCLLWSRGLHGQLALLGRDKQLTIPWQYEEVLLFQSFASGGHDRGILPCPWSRWSGSIGAMYRVPSVRDRRMRCKHLWPSGGCRDDIGLT